MNRFEDYVSTTSIKEFGPIRAPIIASRKSKISDIVMKMAAERTGCVLVLDPGEILAGIFTERDLLRRVIGKGKSMSDLVENYMTPNPDTVASTDTIMKAIRIMHEGCHRHLPVVDGAGRPIGVVGSRSLLRHISGLFPAEIYNLPPDLDQKYYEADGA